MQTRKLSAFETVTNVGSGFFIAMGLNLLVLPFFVLGITQQSIITAIIIGVIYTTVSMLRSYAFRRLFNLL